MVAILPPTSTPADKDTANRPQENSTNDVIWPQQLHRKDLRTISITYLSSVLCHA